MVLKAKQQPDAAAEPEKKQPVKKAPQQQTFVEKKLKSCNLEDRIKAYVRARNEVIEEKLKEVRDAAAGDPKPEELHMLTIAAMVTQDKRLDMDDKAMKLAHKYSIPSADTKRNKLNQLQSVDDDIDKLKAKTEDPSILQAEKNQAMEELSQKKDYRDTLKNEARQAGLAPIKDGNTGRTIALQQMPVDREYLQSVLYTL